MHKNLSSGLCLYRKDVYYHTASSVLVTANAEKRAHPDLNQGPADLQSAALPLSYTPAYNMDSEIYEAT